MSHKQETTTFKVLSTIIYFLGLAMFFEWVYSLNQIVGFDYLYLFIIFAVFCFFIMIVNLPSWITAMIKAVVIIVIVQLIFLPEPVFGDAWRNFIESEIQVNSAAIVARNWHQFTDLFQTIIFLIIIALVSYLLYFWLVQMKRVLVYIGLTVLYVTVMDTFTDYQANQAIIRLAILSILILALNTYLKRITEKQLTINLSRWMIRVGLPLTLTMVTILAIGYFAPKSRPIWPDPVPFIVKVGEQITGSDQSSQGGKFGYSEDDSRLGGTFQMDDTPILYTETSLEHYWRIESKDFYTGKGWKANHPMRYQAYDAGALELIAFNSTNELTHAKVQYTDKINFANVVYPYGVSDISHPHVDMMEYESITGKIKLAEQDLQLVYNEPFEHTYAYPNVSDDQLRAANGAIPHKIASQYLQLPNTLPDRVYQLGFEIVEGIESRYDRAVAIENYFSSGRFRYQIEDVPYPALEQDYVDQFLFETQYGYCDNFSTAMVVLLRTVGIPARWVKGFTSGAMVEDLSTVDQDLYRYQITDSNAHSWVEVYFPQIGWIPFEPTIGFSGSEFADHDDAQVEVDELDEQDRPTTEEEHELLEEDELDSDQDSPDHKIDPPSSSRALLISPSFIIIIVTLILVIMGMVKWKLILTRLIFFYHRPFESAADFTKAYRSLMMLLRFKQLKRQPEQTLHQFAKEVDKVLQMDLMTQLTNEYAQLIYRKGYQLTDLASLYDCYQQLIKRVIT